MGEMTQWNVAIHLYLIDKSITSKDGVIQLELLPNQQGLFKKSNLNKNLAEVSMRILTNVFPILAITIMLFIFGCEQINSPNSETETAITSSDVPVAEAHDGTTVYVDANASGTEDGSQDNPFGTIQDGVDHAGSGETVKLMSDFILTNEVVISNTLTLDGNGNTVFSSFVKSGGDNSAIEVIGTSDVTISNLTIDGSGGTDLHGINVYVSTGVLVSDVLISDNLTGLVVNGSEVTAHNISTSGHSWHAMNVDLGTGVDGPATLTVTGTSSHAESYPTPHIFIDDVNKDVSVDDVESQYEIEESGTARAYFLIPGPETKDDCKEAGWEDFGFKNQGQCIRFVNTGKDSR